MQLSKKLKRFSEHFSRIFISSLNFEHFEKKDHIHSQCPSEIIDCQTSCWTNIWIASLQSTLQQ